MHRLCCHLPSCSSDPRRHAPCTRQLFFAVSSRLSRNRTERWQSLSQARRVAGETFIAWPTRVARTLRSYSLPLKKGDILERARPHLVPSPGIIVPAGCRLRDDRVDFAFPKRLQGIQIDACTATAAGGLEPDRLQTCAAEGARSRTAADARSEPPVPRPDHFSSDSSSIPGVSVSHDATSS